MADVQSSIRVVKANESDIPTINFIAKEVWPVAYKNVIPQEQIAFMLEWMYSPGSLHKQMIEERCNFFILLDDERPMGFASYSKISPSIFKLHKLYIITTSQKRGYGKRLLDVVFNEVQAAGGGDIQLQVNKKNPAINFYKKIGFEILKEDVFDIGHGFVMDDYIMTKKV